MLSHEDIKKDPQRITKIKFFISKYKWIKIVYPSEKDDLKKFEKNNVTITFNVLHAKEYIYILLIFQEITQIVKKKLFF